MATQLATPWRHHCTQFRLAWGHRLSLSTTLSLPEAVTDRIPSVHAPQNVVIRAPLPPPLFSLPSLYSFPPHSSSLTPAASASEPHPAMGSLAAPREALLPLSYPPARRDESVVDDYHGVLIADPYRWWVNPWPRSSCVKIESFRFGCLVLWGRPFLWRCLERRLEDPESEEVKEFVERQARLTDSVLEKCEERERLRRRITALLDHPRYDTPFKRGGKYFYFHNTGLQAQSVLYVQVVWVPTEAKTLSKPESWRTIFMTRVLVILLLGFICVAKRNLVANSAFLLCFPLFPFALLLCFPEWFLEALVCVPTILVFGSFDGMIYIIPSC